MKQLPRLSKKRGQVQFTGIVVKNWTCPRSVPEVAAWPLAATSSVSLETSIPTNFENE